jgi:hypothetical protein
LFVPSRLFGLKGGTDGICGAGGVRRTHFNLIGSTVFLLVVVHAVGNFTFYTVDMGAAAAFGMIHKKRSFQFDSIKMDG